MDAERLVGPICGNRRGHGESVGPGCSAGAKSVNRSIPAAGWTATCRWLRRGAEGVLDGRPARPCRIECEVLHLDHQGQEKSNIEVGDGKPRMVLCLLVDDVYPGVTRLVGDGPR